VDVAANAAPIGFLAAVLRVRTSAVAIRSGAGSRIKILHVAGDGGVMCARLSAWIGRPAKGAARIA
jgi:uncharacterized protein YggU (UPF0235/DUF167 family)